MHINAWQEKQPDLEPRLYRQLKREIRANYSSFLLMDMTYRTALQFRHDPYPAILPYAASGSPFATTRKKTICEQCLHSQEITNMLHVHCNIVAGNRISKSAFSLSPRLALCFLSFIPHITSTYLCDSTNQQCHEKSLRKEQWGGGRR